MTRNIGHLLSCDLTFSTDVTTWFFFSFFVSNNNYMLASFRAKRTRFLVRVCYTRNVVTATALINFYTPISSNI